MLDYFLNDEETVLKKNEKKKKLHELLDKYGSVEEIEKNAIGIDDYEYMFANTDNLIDEVLDERRLEKPSLSVVRKDTPQKRNSLLPRDEDFSLEGLRLSNRQREAIKNLDMSNQLTIVKARRQQQGFEQPHQKTEHNDDLKTPKTKKQYASNEYAGVQSDADKVTSYIPSDGFDDIYHSKLDKNGRVIYPGTEQHEGGYSDRKNDLGGKTNYGITQDSLDEYNYLWESYLKKGKNFPTDVKQLKPIQAKQILDEMYFRRYGINKITNTIITRNVFDEEMNQGTNAGKDIAESVNKLKGTNFPLNKVISDRLATAINRLSSEDTIKVNDLLVLKRMERYFNSVEKDPIHNINNLRGWYQRTQSYHSQPKVFEKLYKDKVDYYIQKKYPQYYNGE